MVSIRQFFWLTKLQLQERRKKHMILFRLLIVLLPPLFFINLVIPLPFGTREMLNEELLCRRGFNKIVSDLPLPSVCNYSPLIGEGDIKFDIEDYPVSNPMHGLLGIESIDFEVCVEPKTLYKIQGEERWIFVEQDAAQVGIHNSETGLIDLKSDKESTRCKAIDKEVYGEEYLFITAHFWVKNSQILLEKLMEQGAITEERKPDDFEADYYADTSNRAIVIVKPVHEYTWLIVWLAVYSMWFAFILALNGVLSWIFKRN